jgi:hypothetical protein
MTKKYISYLIISILISAGIVFLCTSFDNIINTNITGTSYSVSSTSYSNSFIPKIG